MSDLINKPIVISGVEMKEGIGANGAWKLIRIIDDNGDKYSFFLTKKDGSDSKAYEQFKAYNVSIGMRVGVVFKEEEKTFIDKKNKERAFKQRTIVMFEVIPDAIPIPTQNDEIQVGDIPF